MQIRPTDWNAALLEAARVCAHVLAAAEQDEEVPGRALAAMHGRRDVPADPVGVLAHDRLVLVAGCGHIEPHDGRRRWTRSAVRHERHVGRLLRSAHPGTCSGRANARLTQSQSAGVERKLVESSTTRPPLSSMRCLTSSYVSMSARRKR